MTSTSRVATRSSSLATRWPERATCLAWLRAAGVGPVVLGHVQAVETRALAIARRVQAGGQVPVDLGLVAAGALLHDLGRAFGEGPGHGVAGARWLRARGCPEPLALIVERHVLAGLSAADAAAAGLEARDLLPQSIEEKIVSHADNLTGRDGPRPLDRVIDKLARRGAAPALVARLLALDEELRRLASGVL